jgi:hypothetical protein
MAVPLQAYVGLPLATLLDLQTRYVEAAQAIAGGQSYTIAGRSLTRANLTEVSEALQAIAFAINSLQAQNRRRSATSNYYRFV